MAIQRIEVDKDIPFTCNYCESKIFDKAILVQNDTNTSLYHLECYEEINRRKKIGDIYE